MSARDFERSIVGDFPLGEAAAYFVRIKTAASPDDIYAAESEGEYPSALYHRLLAQDLEQAQKRNMRKEAGPPPRRALPQQAAPMAGKPVAPLGPNVFGQGGQQLVVPGQGRQSPPPAPSPIPDWARGHTAPVGGRPLPPPKNAPAPGTPTPTPTHFDPVTLSFKGAMALLQKRAAQWGGQAPPPELSHATVGQAAPPPTPAFIGGRSLMGGGHPAIAGSPAPRPQAKPGMASTPKVALAHVFSALRKLAFDGDVNQWMAQEQMMQQAQEASESKYYQQLAQQNATALQAKEQEASSQQEQMQQLQQQMQDMQSQLDQSGQLQRQVLDQARMVEQQAAQSAASAHQAASAATLQSMQSAQEVMRHKQMTATMQQNVQGWKEQLMDIAQADPTTAAGEQVGMPMSGPAPAMPPSAPPEGGAEVPTEGANPQQAPADQAAQAAGPAGQPPPNGAGEQPQAATEMPTPEQSMSPATKQAAVWEHFRKLSQVQSKGGGAVKTATFRDSALALSQKWQLPQRAVGAALGATVGGGLGFGSSKMDPEKYKARIEELEAEKARGEGSFGAALELAARRYAHGLAEASSAHPLASTLAGSAVGASLGGASAPHVWNLLKSVKPDVADISAALRT